MAIAEARDTRTLLAPRAPLRVSVLVTLFRDEHAGGHVKCWEQVARAATRQPQLDLTVHFLGEREEVVSLSDNVRYRSHPPRLSTLRFGFLSEIPDHTDMAGYNPSLARALFGRDVLHSTDAYFSFAGTARKLSEQFGIPLVNSIHTDTPSYTRLYTARVVERICGDRLGRTIVARCKVDRLAERWMQRMLERHQRDSSYVMVSRPDDYAAACRIRPPREVGTLRRGVDKSLFTPDKRDRAWLQQRFGIAEDRVVVLAVGRLSAGKNIAVLADAMAQLVVEGAPVHLVAVGRGPLEQAIRDRLGAHASCPGVLHGEELARTYASADLLAAPSEIEILSNVVQEALASGLPVVLARRAGLDGLTATGATLVVEDRSVRGWAEALRTVCSGPERRAHMGRAARELAELRLPSWDDVLVEDLLPLWHRSVVDRS